MRKGLIPAGQDITGGTHTFLLTLSALLRVNFPTNMSPCVHCFGSLKGKEGGRERGRGGEGGERREGREKGARKRGRKERRREESNFEPSYGWLIHSHVCRLNSCTRQFKSQNHLHIPLLSSSSPISPPFLLPFPLPSSSHSPYLPPPIPPTFLLPFPLPSSSHSS